MPLWQELNIADALSLSLSPLDKDENLLKAIGYFWSDALNCFLFGHGPMTPTLLDVTMITGLDIGSPDPAAHRMVEVPFKLSSKIDCTNWSTYMNQHMKTKGPVNKKEHSLSESLVRIFHLLWSFLSPNQELSSFGLPSSPWQPHQPRQASPRRNI